MGKQDGKVVGGIEVGKQYEGVKVVWADESGSISYPPHPEVTHGNLYWCIYPSGKKRMSRWGSGFATVKDLMGVEDYGNPNPFKVPWPWAELHPGEVDPSLDYPTEFAMPAYTTKSNHTIGPAYVDGVLTPETQTLMVKWKTGDPYEAWNKQFDEWEGGSVTTTSMPNTTSGGKLHPVIPVGPVSPFYNPKIKVYVGETDTETGVRVVWIDPPEVVSPKLKGCKECYGLWCVFPDGSKGLQTTSEGDYKDCLNWHHNNYDKGWPWKQWHPGIPDPSSVYVIPQTGKPTEAQVGMKGVSEGEEFWVVGMGPEAHYSCVGWLSDGVNATMVIGEDLVIYGKYFKSHVSVNDLWNVGYDKIPPNHSEIVAEFKGQEKWKNPLGAGGSGEPMKTVKELATTTHKAMAKTKPTIATTLQCIKAIKEYCKVTPPKYRSNAACYTWILENYKIKAFPETHKWSHQKTEKCIEENLHKISIDIIAEVPEVSLGTVMAEYKPTWTPPVITQLKQAKPIPPTYVPKTQKEQGYIELEKGMYKNYVLKYTMEPFYQGMGEIFARPCPVRPRHGFVDSRVVHTIEEYESLREEVRKADPEGEIMLVPTIKEPKCSAVYTPGRIEVGGGNDGATAGKGEVVSFSISPERLQGVNYNNGGIKDTPYFEIVYQGKSGDIDNPTKTWITQLRDGPELPKGSEDFVPPGDGFVVKEIVKVEHPEDYSLLEWEERVKGFPEGTVVWFPKGNLSSHIVIHAVVKGVPVLTTREPVIGEKLVATVEKGEGTVKWRRGQVEEGYAAGMLIRMPAQQMMWCVMAGLHNGVWLFRGRPFMLGLTAALGVRLAGALGQGELRYYTKADTGSKLWNTGKSRGTVYHEVLQDYKWSLECLRWAPLLYHAKGHWSGSFGGPKWGSSMDAAVAVNDSVTSGETEEMVIEKLNILVNSCHNGGKLFTKVGRPNQISNNIELGAVLVAHYWWEALGMARERGEEIALVRGEMGVIQAVKDMKVAELCLLEKLQVLEKKPQYVSENYQTIPKLPPKPKVPMGVNLIQIRNVKEGYVRVQWRYVDGVHHEWDTKGSQLTEAFFTWLNGEKEDTVKTGPSLVSGAGVQYPIVLQEGVGGGKVYAPLGKQSTANILKEINHQCLMSGYPQIKPPSSWTSESPELFPVPEATPVPVEMEALETEEPESPEDF